GAVDVTVTTPSGTSATSAADVFTYTAGGGGGGGGGGGCGVQGYDLIAKDGGVFSFCAPFFGSTGSIKLNQPIVGGALTTSRFGSTRRSSAWLRRRAAWATGWWRPTAASSPSVMRPSRVRPAPSRSTGRSLA